MNTEEKARAYDEAMDKIKPLYEQAKRDGNPIWSTYEYIISELAESEDERIRKGLIDALTVSKSVGELKFRLPEPTRKEAIAWLEKQKEHSMSAEEVLAKAGLKPYKDGNKWCILAGDNIQEGICGFGDTIDETLYQFLLEVLEKQKDKMTAEENEIVKVNINGIRGLFPPVGDGHYIDEHIALDKTAEEKQKEQKPSAESISQLTVQSKGVYKICPHCKERMIRDDSKVYTSMPPQYGYKCPKCGEMEFDTIMYDNPEMEEQKPAEWVLPKDFEEAVYKVANFISPFDNQEELRKTSHRFAEQLLSLAKKELDKPAEWDELQSEFKNSNEEFEDGKKEVVAHPERYGLCKPAEWSKDTLDEFTENIRSLITRKLTYHDPNGSGISSTVFIDDETAKDIANGVLFYVGKEAVKNPKREIPEWSEEDEKHLNSILDAIDYWETTSGQGILLDTDINWLKFLRWKKH